MGTCYCTQSLRYECYVDQSSKAPAHTMKVTHASTLRSRPASNARTSSNIVPSDEGAFLTVALRQPADRQP